MIILNPEHDINNINPFRTSVFLAGPTPRSSDILSWRPQAIDLLKKNDYGGYVYVPERKDWKIQFDYCEQIEWELQGLDDCEKILFWVPRDMETMPSLTTNCEFGMFIKSGKVWYGRPEDSVKNKYLDYLYVKYTGKKPMLTI
jgi:hypothetical protein